MLNAHYYLLLSNEHSYKQLIICLKFAFMNKEWILIEIVTIEMQITLEN